MKSVLDKAFVYTPAANTDIRETFKRIAREQKKADKKAQEHLFNRISNVRQINRR